MDAQHCPHKRGTVMAYTYTTIDAPGATSTYIYDINDQGAAAGPYNDATGDTHGFVYDHGVLGTIDRGHDYQRPRRGCWEFHVPLRCL